MRIFMLFFLFNCSIAAQGFYGEIGAGPGFSVGGEPLFRDKVELRGMLFAGFHYQFNRYFSLGVEGTTSFDIQPSESFTDRTIMMNEGERLDSFNFTSNFLVLKPVYYFNYMGFKSFVAISFGTNTFINRLFFDEGGTIQRKKRTNLAVVPELGVKIENFTISIKYIYGGRTVGFDGENTNGTPVFLQSASIGQIYIAGSYRFLIKKRRIKD